MKKIILFALMILVLGLRAEEEKYEIRTTDGEIYSPAVVEHVTPSGIDIGYLDFNGRYRMKGIPFTRLPVEIQEKYGYNPEKAREFDDKVRRYTQGAEPALPVKPVELPVEPAKPEPPPASTFSPENMPSLDRLKQIGQDLQSALQGQNVALNATDLAYAFYAGRRAVSLSVVERAKNGTVVQVTRDDSGRRELPDLILLNGLQLEKGGEWVGFIYPTGLRASIVGSNAMPVFCDSAENAALLVEQFLELRSSYQAANQPKNNSGVQGVDSKGKYSGPAGNYGINDGNYIYWGYSSWYWPNWEYPRPVRPRPPRPPQPPCPPPKPPVPKPEPGKRPGGLQVFPRGGLRQVNNQ